MPINFANRITICRILAVPFFISSVLYFLPERDYLRFVSLGIFLLAVITDVIDGYIARSRHQKTQAGAILDPLADKLLLISAFICLYKVGVHFEVLRFPIWLIVAIISRDVILLIGSSLIYMFHRRMPLETTFWGKASTFFQALIVIGMLMQFSHSEILWYFAAFFTVVSGLDYIRKGIVFISMPDEQGSEPGYSTRIPDSSYWNISAKNNQIPKTYRKRIL